MHLGLEKFTHSTTFPQRIFSTLVLTKDILMKIMYTEEPKCQFQQPYIFNVKWETNFNREHIRLSLLGNKNHN